MRSEGAATSSRAGKPTAWLLSAVGGAVDALGYVTLFHLFTGNHTGNTVAFSTGIGHYEVSTALRRGFPIALFVLGVALGTALSWGGGKRAILFFEMGVLALFMGVGRGVDLGSDVHHLTRAYWAVAAFPALAMGAQSRVLEKVGKRSVHTTFITAMIVKSTEETIRFLRTKKKSAASHARLTGGIAFFYAAGAAASTFAHAAFGWYATLFPIAGLLVAAMVIGPAPGHVS